MNDRVCLRGCVCVCGGVSGCLSGCVSVVGECYCVRVDDEKCVYIIIYVFVLSQVQMFIVKMLNNEMS